MNADSFLFFGDTSNSDLSEKIGNALGVKVCYPDISVFPDGEQRVSIRQEVAGRNIAVVKSLCPPVDSNLIQFCFIVDALKRNGAGKVLGVIPYFGYMRADHMFRTGDPVPFEVVIDIIERRGLSKILFIDPHTIKASEIFHIPVMDESALSLFAEKIKSLNLDLNFISVVSPDMGGIRRIKILSELLEGVSYATINKDRDLDTGIVSVAAIEGAVKSTCIIVDDMISSGATVEKAVEALYRRGVKEMYVFATHPVFSVDASRRLESMRVEKIFVTDTIYIPDAARFDKLEIVSVSDVIAARIKENL